MKSKEKFKEMHRKRERYAKIVKIRRKYLRSIEIDSSTKYDLVDDLKWSKDVDEDIEFLSENLAFWASMAANALETFKNFEAKTKVIEAKLNNYWRIKLAKTKGGKPTNPEVDTAVHLDPKWYKTQKKLNALYKRYDILNESAKASIKMKKDLLQTRSSNIRAEKERRIRSKLLLSKEEKEL